jgi:DNA/RNA-binding domain of Phe-tRNA-synthetase-like protein
MLVSIEVTDEVSRAYPTLQIRLVVARGLSNDIPWPATDRLLAELTAEFGAGSWEPKGEADPEISSWFDVYRSFGVNPRRSRPSVDALGRRMRRTGELPRINSAVDSYNAVSVRHGLPAGAYDLAALTGPVMLRTGRDQDVFIPLGEPDERETPQPGEIVYAEGERVLTRHWNHRDSDLTKLTETSRDAVFLLERVDGGAVSDGRMKEAQEELADLVRPHARDVGLHVIEPQTPVARLTDG